MFVIEGELNNVTLTTADHPDPKLDLVLTRELDIPRELVWLAWTRPEYLRQWFAPRHWSTVDCELDVRPGGQFRTVLRSPDGQLFPNRGCYLEVAPHERLVWTNAVAPHFQASERSRILGVPLFTAVLTFEPVGRPGHEAEATRYTAVVLHGSEADCQKHLALGFHAEWGRAVDQLVVTAKRLQVTAHSLLA